MGQMVMNQSRAKVKARKAKIFLLSFEALERTVALIIQMTCRPALNPSRPGKLALTLASLALSKPEAYGAKAVA
jgi:hypothetical protein